jgi:Ca2+-binding RTX toxin-like protein
MEIEMKSRWFGTHATYASSAHFPVGLDPVAKVGIGSLPFGLTDYWADASTIRPNLEPLLTVITGTSGADTLISGAGSDSLSGLAGNDTLLGNGGNDTLNGGSGTDRMVGGTGNDLYRVDSTGDIVVEAADSGIDTIRVSAFMYVLPANVENLTGVTLAGVPKYSSGQTLIGNDLANVITGSYRGDWIAGLGGHDTLKGGLGNDVYIVETKGDVVTEAFDAGWDLVLTDIPVYTLPVNVDEVEGISASGQRFTGNAQDNYLGGDWGADTLNGGDGRDGLCGFFANDVLTGGAGQDFFQFRVSLGAGNIDTITDFNAFDEEIDLQRNGAGLFNTLSATGWLDPSAFKVIEPGGSAVDSSDRIIYNQSTGQLYYDADGSGAGAMVQFAYLSNHAALSAWNFWVFDW